MLFKMPVKAYKINRVPKRRIGWNTEVQRQRKKEETRDRKLPVQQRCPHQN
jgi:hypothetical protein